MDFEIEKVLRPLDLGDYLGEGENAYRGKLLSVWVNPSGEVRAERHKLLDEFQRVMSALGGGVPKKVLKFWQKSPAKVNGKDLLAQVESVRVKTRAWLAKMLSQDAENVCSADDLKRLQDADPTLYDWILAQVVEMIAAYHEEKKRTSKARSLN